MEVVGRHALLFDDDATCAFVNSREALVEWNSLLIDRYDVRHLVQSLPPLLKRRRQSDPQDLLDLDQIRYQDLPHQQQENNGASAADGGIYHAVSFAYGNTDSSIETRDSDVCGFIPPFPVPDSLLQSLPPTEKLHQIMARTALFVSEHGGQSEIVLRVKQGNNPTFGFLMPDHHLHAYFRFLVDHPEVLKSGDNTKTSKFENAGLEQNQRDVAGEALSLLGSVYGSGEDEDGAVLIVSGSKDDEPGDTINATSGTLDHGSEQAVSSGRSTAVDIGLPKNPLPVSKENGSLSNKIHSAGAAASTKFSKKKEGNVLESLPGSLDKRVCTLLNASTIGPVILEPPSEIKRMVDKIVEFVLKNGKEFEAVLVEQDHTKGRFPFLLPTNQYHAYYLKRIQKAQESKQAGKNSTSEKHDSVGHVSSRGSISRDGDTLLKESVCHDLPYDLERKEKFKMVISGSKRDTQEPAPKSTQQQCGMSVDAAAAILQAATRGLRNPKVQMPTKTNMVDSVQGSDIEGRSTSSIGSLPLSSQMRSSTSKPVSGDEPSVCIPVELSKLVGLSKEASGPTDVSVAKAIAKTAALAAASEADSSEACLTKEQKQKAERLKRAKMFAAMIKTGAVPQKNELIPRLSTEPPDSLISGLAGSGFKSEMTDGSQKVPGSCNISDARVVDVRSREREGSSAPVVDKMEKCTKMDSGDDYKERSSRKRHHSRSRRVDEDDEDDDEERSSRKRHHSRSRRVDEDDEDDDEERSHKHSRKNHHSRHSSHHNRGERRHRKGHSSSKDRESRHRHKYDSSSDEEEYHTRRSYKHRVSQSERKEELENESRGKLLHESNTLGSVKIASRETSVDLINDGWKGSTPLNEAQPSDDLRAKVRAMLLATL